MVVRGLFSSPWLTQCLEGPLVVFIGNLLKNALFLKAPSFLPVDQFTLNLLDDLQRSQYDSCLCPDKMYAIDATAMAPFYPATTGAPAYLLRCICCPSKACAAKMQGP